eukprot:TRINITY_DN1401_c6_g1_i1.p2 TRINITY_DN1401_c6_g1~~TRINITY_DN1401_c6_g1_i1.p2  ORF type:complete len:114 (+),score=1.24 TRINITY_DN1401_c6_g1_i1:430-771(+)
MGDKCNYKGSCVRVCGDHALRVLDSLRTLCVYQWNVVHPARAVSPVCVCVAVETESKARRCIVFCSPNWVCVLCNCTPLLQQKPPPCNVCRMRVRLSASPALAKQLQYSASRL